MRDEFRDVEGAVCDISNKLLNNLLSNLVHGERKLPYKVLIDFIDFGLTFSVFLSDILNVNKLQMR